MKMFHVDCSQMMHQNLSAVFSERDADARMRAIESLYSTDPTLYEPENIVQGRQAISDTIGRLLANLPSGFAFTVAGPAIGHHDLCCVPWQGGPPENPAMITGTDVVHFEQGKIKSLYVLITPPAK